MKNRFGIATAATLALFSLSACGSDDSDSSGKETSKEPSPTQTTPTQEATPTETATSAAPVATAANTPPGTKTKNGDTARHDERREGHRGGRTCSYRGET